MSISLSVCKQAHPLVSFPNKFNNPLVNFPNNPIATDSFNGWRRKEKVIVVMGATGTGKSRLSIDLANRFLPAEIINSDKMQVYEGLDVVTNKVTEEEQSGIPHHLLGVVDQETDFTSTDFRHFASLAVGSITARNHLPIIVGGSNSYIEALVDDEDLEFRSKYECCFLWVDVSLPVLHSFVSVRVDRMIEAGLLDEVRNIFNPEADYNTGIRRAIGVPELDRYLRARSGLDHQTRIKLLEEAINEIKANNCQLVCRQLSKIHRLRSLPGWKVHRLDATEAFLNRGKEADEAWDNHVAGPSRRIVTRFLYDEEHLTARRKGPTAIPSLSAAVMGAAVATATH